MPYATLCHYDNSHFCNVILVVNDKLCRILCQYRCLIKKSEQKACMLYMLLTVLLYVGGKIQMRNMRVTLADSWVEINLFCVDGVPLMTILKT